MKNSTFKNIEENQGKWLNSDFLSDCKHPADPKVDCFFKKETAQPKIQSNDFLAVAVELLLTTWTIY